MKIEEFIGRNKGKVRILAGFALVFVLGFASGYYYSDENRSSEILTIKDGSTDCAALFKAEAQSGDVKAEQDSVTAADKSNVAGDSASAENAAGTVLSAGTAAAPQPGKNVAAKAFAGSKNSTIYHTRDCQYVKRIKAENLVWFSSKQEAETAGRKPHSCVKQ